MNVTERIHQQIAEHPVLLYMKGTPSFPQCGFSSRAVNALTACKVDFEHVNVLEEPEIRQALPQIANWPTFPQLWVRGELIGGSDIILELYQSGELETMLKTTS